VPIPLHDGLIEYIADRRPTGDFLRAVLTNDFRDAVSRADHDSRIRLFELVTFLNTYAPAPCWGSVTKVKEWLADPEPPMMLFEGP
jgi:hypothetical protein